MKIALVTTFNEKLYRYYAHRFMSTYNWPFDCYIYHEGWIPEIDPMRSNIIYRNIFETNPELNAFIHRNLSRNIDSHYDKDITPVTDYKMDAIRFSYKVFAKTHLMLDCDYDYVFWVDADTVFKKTQGTDLMKVFDSEKLNNPITDIIDSYYIMRAGYEDSISNDI